MKLSVFILLALFVTAIQSAPTEEEESRSTTETSSAGTDDNSSKEKPEKPVTKAGADDKSTSDEEIDHVIDNIVSKIDVLLVEVNDEALEKCISSNNTVALSKARRADEDLEKCLEPALNAFELLIELDLESFDMEIIKNITKKFCEVYPPIEEKCTADYYRNIESCLSDGDMKGMKTFDKMAAAGLKYLCNYGPDILIEAAQNEFGCNLIEHITSIVFCVIPPFQEIVRNNHTAMAIPRLLNGKGCRLYKEMSHCIHEELKTCKNKTYSDIIVGFFNVTASALPECPSERTEWEQYMGQVVGQLYKEEHAQTELLKSMKSQINQLIAANVQQEKFYQKDNENNQKIEKALHSILGVLNGIKKET